MSSTTVLTKPTKVVYSTGLFGYMFTFLMEPFFTSMTCHHRFLFCKFFCRSNICWALVARSSSCSGYESLPMLPVCGVRSIGSWASLPYINRNGVHFVESCRLDLYSKRILFRSSSQSSWMMLISKLLKLGFKCLIETLIFLFVRWHTSLDFTCKNIDKSQYQLHWIYAGIVHL